MEKPELYTKIEEVIDRSRMRYEEVKEDWYSSTVRAEELRTLQSLYERLKNGESRENLLVEMKKKLPELEDWMEGELERPTFDWYDDHYHYKILDGQHSAYKIMIDLLECEA